MHRLLRNTVQWRQLGHTVLAVAIVATTFSSQSLAFDETGLEPVYVERRKALDERDLQSALELASWCRERGFIREMLHSVTAVLKESPNDPAARGFLRHQRDVIGWVSFLPTPNALDRTPAPKAEVLAAREELLDQARKRVFKMVKRAFRFAFWSDLGNDRVTDYAAIMNRYYDHTRGFFGGAETKAGIPVRLYSKRSEYLRFYQTRTGKSGEHVAGFFSYDGRGNPYLCFYDDIYDDENVFNTARHECTHLLLRQSLRGATVAHWLDEGAACYLAASGLERVGGYAALCLLTVRADLRNFSVLTLRDLMNAPYKDFTFRHYATAWAWICYLSADSQLKRKLTQLFLKVREKTRDSATEGWRSSDWESASNDLFEKVVGNPEKLQLGFADFVEEDLEPQTDDQQLFATINGLQIVLSADARGLADAKVLRLLREAEGWLRSAKESKDVKIRARARLEEIRAFLARATALRYDEVETSHVAVEIASRLDEFLCDRENDFLLQEVGRVAHQVLQVIRNVGKYKPERDTPFDLVDEVSQRVEGMTEVGKTRLRFHRDVVENLITLCSHAYRLSLSQDPSQRRASVRWLFLALDFAPGELKEVFPHLLFQVQLDPDDVGLASLATVYAAMGKDAYAKTLFERALRLTPNKDSLGRFAAYVTGEESE